MVSSKSPISIIVADDHPLFLDSLKGMVNCIADFALVGAASNGKQLIDLTRKLAPDIILTDVMMPVMDGIQATKQIMKELPATGIIALTMIEEGSIIADVLEAGAKGYLLKSAPSKEIIDAVKTVHNNGRYFSKEIDASLLKLVARNDFQCLRSTAKSKFSEKENNVIKLICREYSNKQIAFEMGITKRAVDGIRDNILKKACAKNTAGIVLYAIQNNIYQLDEMHL